jgi:hypothetical protein
MIGTLLKNIGQWILIDSCIQGAVRGQIVKPIQEQNSRALADMQNRLDARTAPVLPVAPKMPCFNPAKKPALVLNDQNDPYGTRRGFRFGLPDPNCDTRPRSPGRCWWETPAGGWAKGWNFGPKV